MRRRAWILALVVLAVTARARAHSVLQESWVGLASGVLQENTEVPLKMRFTGELKPKGCSIEMVPDHGEPRVLKLVFGPFPGDIASVLPRLPAGRYVLRYRVLAADGHTTEGSLPLRVIGSE